MAVRPTLLDVARAAGVSPKTVSRVVNGEPNVSAGTSARVREAIQSLGFRPNDVARSLRPGQRSHMLGLVIGDLANPFYAHIARGVEEEARRRGYLVVIGSSEEDPARERDLVHAFCGRRVDGMLVVPAGNDHRYLGAEIDAGTPFVFIDRPAIGIQVDIVVIDNREGARRGVEYLIDQGHRRIGMVADLPSLYTAVERAAGYREALAGAGIPVDQTLVRLGAHDAAQARLQTRELLTLPDPPTAIFAENNRVCVGVLQAAARRADGSFNPPAVVGFDELELAGALSLPLDIVRYDTAEIGRRAARLLFDRIDGDRGPARWVVIPTELIPFGAHHSVAAVPAKSAE